MKVFRVENKDRVGPIYGVKSKIKIYYDYRDNERYIESRKRICDMRNIEFHEGMLFGSFDDDISFDSKEVIIEHPTPRENKPYFHNRYHIGTFGYYRFGEEYCFGWKSFKQCIDFVIKKRKNKWILHREGFFISEYHINDKIIFPDGQIAFKKNKAKLIKKYKNCFS